MLACINIRIQTLQTSLLLHHAGGFIHDEYKINFDIFFIIKRKAAFVILNIGKLLVIFNIVQ